MKSSKIMHLLCDTVMLVIESVVRLMLWTSRKILKKYLNIETPLYKMWWKNNCKRVQKLLDKEHSEFELGKSFTF